MTGKTLGYVRISSVDQNLERALIRERQPEGIALAKKKGVYKGRKKVLDAAQVLKLRERVQAGEPKSALARELGISRETLYRYLVID